MKTLALAGLTLGLMTALPAAAQWDNDHENARRYCASGRSGLDYGTCMRRMQGGGWRDDRYDRDYGRRDPRWGNDRYDRGYGAPPPPAYRYGGEPPRLSDMQERALQNCALLAPRDQPRCRATVMSTVRP